MSYTLLAFGLFAFCQLLLWIIAQDNNIASYGEIMTITFIIALFMGLFFAGYRWARWVAVVLLGIFALFIGSATFEGFGVSFILISFLYGGVIFLLFKYQPESDPAQTAEPEPTLSEMTDSQTLKPLAENEFYVGEEIYHYPLLIKRYQSLFIDSMLILLVMVVVMVLMDESDARQIVMVSLWCVFAFGYEPLLTTYSATIGQRLMGIRVRNINNPKERINIVQAYVRIIVKWLLGWLSFLTINFNREHRAIHDIAGSSVVIKVR
jgi:uncharacterized RDD family membrane protein YckC